MLKDAQADVILTGELSHHETLHFIQNGQIVLLLGHWHSEHGFLEDHFASQLSIELNRSSDDLHHEFFSKPIRVELSQKDYSPWINV